MPVKDYFVEISDELFAYSYSLTKDDRQAFGLLLDSIQAFFIEDSALLDNFIREASDHFLRRSAKKFLLTSIYKIGIGRGLKDILGKSVLFFRHKGSLNIDEIIEVLSISRNDFIVELNQQREQLLGHEYQLDNVDGCRLSRTILSQFDLDQRSDKWENHLQKCNLCQVTLSQLNSLLIRVDEHLEYRVLSTRNKEELDKLLDIIIKDHQNKQQRSVFEEGRVFLQVIFSKKMSLFYLGIVVIVIAIRLLF